MTWNAKPGLLRAADGPMGAPQQFWGDSVRYNMEKIEIALYLAVFVTRDRERYVKEHTKISNPVNITTLGVVRILLCMGVCGMSLLYDN